MNMHKKLLAIGLTAGVVLMAGFSFASAANDGFALRGKRLPWTTGEKWNLTSGYLENYLVWYPTWYKIDYAKRFDDLTPNQSATIDQPVLAIGDGTVEFIRTTDPWPTFGPIIDPPETYYEALGKFVVINHGAGYYTQYDHLNSVSVNVGDSITSGEQVGLSGNTGFSVGYHIQTSLWKDGWHFSVPEGIPVKMEDGKSVFGTNVTLGLSPITFFENTTNHFYIAQDPVTSPPVTPTPTPTPLPTKKELLDKSLGKFQQRATLAGEIDFGLNHEAMSADEP